MRAKSSAEQVAKGIKPEQLGAAKERLDSVSKF